MCCQLNRLEHNITQMCQMSIKQTRAQNNTYEAGCNKRLNKILLLLKKKKTGHHDTAEILLKVALNAINQIKSNLGGFVYIVLCNWCISWVTVTLTHISAEDGVYCRDNIILQRAN